MGLYHGPATPPCTGSSSEERVVISIRSAWVVLLGFFLLSSSAASAGDYTVAYAFDAGDENDTGKIADCAYEKPCYLKSEKLSLSMVLTFWGQNHDEVHVRVGG